MSFFFVFKINSNTGKKFTTIYSNTNACHLQNKKGNKATIFLEILSAVYRDR